jgi:hypothetical protein
MSKTDKKQVREIRALERVKDRDINLSDVPEVHEWSDAVVGKFYRPIKKQLTIRLDAVVSAIIIGPFAELYFGPPYLVNKQHHPVFSFGFCWLPFFASSRFLARGARNRLVGRPLLNDLGTAHIHASPFFQ